MKVNSMSGVVLPGIQLTEDAGACLQDFETTIQAYVTPQHLLGALNFSAMWNPVTYIYDTAIGDNPHIIESFLAPSGSDKRKLYLALESLINAGAVSVLIRKSVQVEGKVLYTHPRITQLYEGWLARDKGSCANFLTSHHGDLRMSYNRVMDQLLDRNAGSIKYYDPDSAKPAFRTLIQEHLAAGDAFRQLVYQMPAPIPYEYERQCRENQFMTTVDLWRLVNPLTRTNKVAEKLVHALGFMNQQAIASSVSAGISGSDWGHGYRPPSAGQMHEGFRRSEEVLEHADLVLEAPAIELLGQIAPVDVLAIRGVAQKTIFKLEYDSAKATAETIRSEVVSAMREYWGQACAHIDTRYPDQTKNKVPVYSWVDRNVQPLKRLYKKSPLFRDSIDILTKLLFKQDPTGAAPLTQGLVKRAAVAMLYSPSDRFRALKAIESSHWSPNAVWTNQRE